MAQVFFCILLLLSLSGTFCKYVYVDEKKTRGEALSYCRQSYTDLASVSNEQDNLKLMELCHNDSSFMWFGLVKNPSLNKWLWSGGGEVTCFFWNAGQPNNPNDEFYGLIDKNGRWYDVEGYYSVPFFCYSAVVVQENKTWEEALEYCREQYDDLASVASDTEMLLIQRELQKHDTTDHVWIGLRFLSGDWLWVDGQEMDYEDWGQGGNPSCPDPKMKCGGIQAGGSQSVWEARDCEERLNFICY